MADIIETKTAVEELGRAWKAYRDTNDERLSTLEAGVKGTAEIETKLARIDADVERWQKTIGEVENRMNKMLIGGEFSGDQRNSEHRELFASFVRKGRDEDKLAAFSPRALSTADEPDTGVFATESMEAVIDRVAPIYSPMRSLATVQTISTNSYKKLVRTGGAASGWVAEDAARTETTGPQLSSLDFPAHEIYANIAATQTLLDDSSIDIESWLGEEVAIEFAAKEGASFIAGDGLTMPKGILSYTAVANGSYAWGKVGYVKTGVADAFAAANPEHAVLDLVHALKPQYRANGTLLMNDLTQSVVRKWVDGAGNYLWQPSLQAGTPATLCGYPVVTDDNMPDIGSAAYPIAFGDFKRGYLIVDRIGTRILRDPYSNKPFVMFYVTKRVGGGIQNFEAVKLIKCAV